MQFAYNRCRCDGLDALSMSSLACACVPNYALNGTSCVSITSCPCYDAMKNVFRGSSDKWRNACETCQCLNNAIVCEPNCPTVACDEVGAAGERTSVENKNDCRLLFVSAGRSTSVLPVFRVRRYSVGR